MKFYLATSFIFPRSFRLRLFAICFTATHLPLVSFLIWGLATGRLALPELILLTGATAAGTLLALAGISGLLQPIHRVAQALSAIEKGGTVEPFPVRRDVVGQLFASVDRAAQASRARISQLDIAAHEDMLTGIANRRGFLAHIERLTPQHRRGCLALIDLDHFKKLNDRYGHDVGDMVLRDFAARLAAGVRRTDYVARWGGEEFAIFFQDALETQAVDVLERLRSEEHTSELQSH